MRSLVAIGCWVLLLGQPVRSQEPPGPCPEDGGALRLKSVTPDGDLALSDGRMIRLAGIRLPDEASLRAASREWLHRQVGRPAAVRQPQSPDRWRRTPGRLLLASETGCVDVAERLVEQGWALVDPGSPALVSPGLQRLERRARELDLGLWADARYKSLAAGEVDRMRPWIGRFVFVEGRVRSIGERRQQTFLNFGSDWANDFTIVIPKRVWSAMAARGQTAAALKGRRIRARGILEDWQGPALTVTEPEMIEALDDERARR